MSYIPLLIFLVAGLGVLWWLSTRQPPKRPPPPPVPPPTELTPGPKKPRQVVFEFPTAVPGTRAAQIVLTDPVVIQLGREEPSLQEVDFVQLRAEDVSGYHGLIKYDEPTKTYFLEYHPRASSPIYVDGALLKRNFPMALRDGSVLQFGQQVRLTFRLPGETASRSHQQPSTDWTQDLDE